MRFSDWRSDVCSSDLRVRALGFPAPSSITEMVAMAEIVEDTGNPTAEQMVEMLVADHERIVRRLRAATVTAEELHDVVTAGVWTRRLRLHEPAVWRVCGGISREWERGTGGGRWGRECVSKGGNGGG